MTRTALVAASSGRAIAGPPLASTSQAARSRPANRAIWSGLGSGLDGGKATTSGASASPVNDSFDAG